MLPPARLLSVAAFNSSPPLPSGTLMLPVLFQILLFRILTTGEVTLTMPLVFSAPVPLKVPPDQSRVPLSESAPLPLIVPLEKVSESRATALATVSVPPLTLNKPAPGKAAPVLRVRSPLFTLSVAPASMVMLPLAAMLAPAILSVVPASCTLIPLTAPVNVPEPEVRFNVPPPCTTVPLSNCQGLELLAQFKVWPEAMLITPPLYPPSLKFTVPLCTSTRPVLMKYGVDVVVPVPPLLRKVPAILLKLV